MGHRAAGSYAVGHSFVMKSVAQYAAYLTHNFEPEAGVESERGCLFLIDG